MDEARHTARTYEANADAYTEKYRAGSVVELHGDAFVDALPTDAEHGGAAERGDDTSRGDDERGDDATRDSDGRVRVLDAGCGPGSDAAAFSDRGFDVVGIDVTQSFLRAARRDVDGAFARGDLRALPLRDAAVGGVWCCAALHHLPKADAAAALAEFRRVLRPDGALFCSVKRGSEAGFEADDDHGGGDERFFAYYAGDEFRALLADAGFEPTVRVDDRWVSTVTTPA